MAFWGIEVKPGKPYTHIHDSSHGVLRLSQATLGNGTATKRSVVQCNVGNKKPVLLCSLLPDKVESCSLDLQFEEDDEVVFSVVGPRSVHLTGYFLGESRHSGGEADDSDSYGEDIWEMGSEDSDSYSSEDEYEADSIDDGDIEMSPSPRPNSGVVIEEIVEDEKPANGITNDRLLENEDHVNDSDEGEDTQRQIIVKNSKSSILESEDEDGFPISFSSGKKDNGKNSDDSKTLDADRKRKLDAILPKVSERKGKVDAVNNEKSKKKKKDKVKSLKSHVTDIGTPGELIGNEPTDDQNKDADDKRDEEQLCQGESEQLDEEGRPHELTVIENSGKLKKKRKDRVKREETSETRVNLLDNEAGEGASAEQIEAMNNVKLANTENNQGVVSGKNKLNRDNIGSSISSATSDHIDKSKKKKKKTKDGNPLNNENKSSTTLGDENEKSQRTQLNEKEISNPQEKTDEDQLVGKPSHNRDGNSSAGSKKKQKNKKLQDNDSAIDKLELRNEAPVKPRTFANGLVIEERSMGQPDGKRASPGKTVFVRYIGKLWNGKIFDSNVGQKPFKFRLGVGQVIKGWDVGVDGMRIGDKRRLTIPPSMGYGEKGAGGVIPGNSWLIFDVELVDVK